MTTLQSIKIHGSKCRYCTHFPDCAKPQVKSVRVDSEICHWDTNRFVVDAALAIDTSYKVKLPLLEDVK